MKQKSKERLQAIKLRKQGKSLAEIAVTLKVAKSTVSNWVSDIPLSSKATQKLKQKIAASQKAGGQRKHAQSVAAVKYHFLEAQKQLAKSTLNPTHQALVCALIYWCEGAKDDNIVAFTNSDPDLTNIFLRFLRNNFFIDESKFRVCLHLHKYHNQQKQMNYWSKITKIPLCQFIKPYQKTNTSIQKHENYQGCVSIRYHSTDTARQLHALAKAAFTFYNQTC